MLQAVRFFYLLLFIVVASQGIFYFMSVAKALQFVSLETFIEQRKAIERSIEIPIKVLYIFSVLTAISILLFKINDFNSIFFITVAVSFAFLLGDVFLALSKSIPLNTLIRNYTSSADQNVYEAIRTEWLFYIRVRGFLAISGLLVLLAGFVYDCKK